MSEGHSGATEEIRFRVPLPIVIPIGAVLVIGATTFGMSRILLNVPKEVAVIIALAVAANVLGVCAYVATRPAEARASWAELLIIATYPIVIGAVLALIGVGEGTVAHEKPPGAPAPAAGNVVVASGIAFNTSELTFKAGEETQLVFKNEDTVQHNLGIYESEGGKELFKGQIINGGQETTYTIPPLKKGEYHFQCDVHPSMNGTVTVE
jgi:plastocyanin